MYSWNPNKLSGALSAEGGGKLRHPIPFLGTREARPPSRAKAITISKGLQRVYGPLSR